METVSLETFDAGNAGQLRTIQRTAGEHDKTGAQLVTAIGADQPALFSFEPSHGGDHRLEKRRSIQIEVPANPARMLEDFGCEGVLRFRDIAGFLKQGQVDVALGIAGCTGVAIPVPGSTKVAGLVDDADILVAGGAQSRCGQQSTKAAANHQRLDIAYDRRAAEVRIRMGIVEQAGKLAVDFDVLIVTIRTQATVTFEIVFLAQRGRIEIRLRHRWF